MTAPMFSPDRPAESDSLGRAAFGAHLAKALVSVSSGDGLVVAIEGGWGSGKSTIVGFVKTALQEFAHANTNADTIVVDFNPWIVSNSGALVDALITQIASAINLNSGAPEKALKAGEKLLGYVGLIKHLKYLKYVPGVSFAGHLAEDVDEIAGNITDGVKGTREGLEDLKKLLPTLDLSKRKSEVVEALRELDVPIVVIVDDIDRLPPDEIRTVVQAIKAVADFPRTTYLLAYDRDVVSAALGNGSLTSGMSYLEKIVQVAYPIPPLFEYQLRGFVDQQVKSLLSSLGIKLRAFELLNYQQAIGLVAKLARHPRDVVRLLNRLMLSLPATKNEVNAVDVIVFEALSQRFPIVRESVHRHPTDFTGYGFRGDAGYEDENFDWANWASLEAERKSDRPSWEKYLPEFDVDRAAATNACAFLFPEGAGKRERVPEDELHIADPDRLARYFRMMSLDSVPEASHIHYMLLNPHDLAEALATGDSSELTFLLEWVYNYLPSCEAPDTVGVAEVIVQRAILLESSTDLTSDLAESFVKVLARLVRTAASPLKNKCFEFVIGKAPLSISEKVLLEAAAEQGKWPIRPDMIRGLRYQLVPDDEVVNTAIDTWSARVRDACEIGSIFKNAKMHSILYRFAQLNSAYKETYSAVRKICSTDDGLRAFLSVYVRDSPFDSLDQYSLIEDAYEIAERINASALNEEYSWFATKIIEAPRANGIKDQSSRLLRSRKAVNLGTINSQAKEEIERL